METHDDEFDYQDEEVSEVEKKSKKCCNKQCCVECMRYNLLAILTFTAVVIGVIVGMTLKGMCAKDYWTDRRVLYVSFLGKTFLSMMECMIVPLISATIIDAISSTNVKYSKIIAFKGALYYISMTLIAVCVGIILVITIAPGKGPPGSFNSYLNNSDVSKECGLVQDNVLDVLRSFFPNNIFQATMELGKTRIILKKCETNEAGKTCIEYRTCDDYEKAKKIHPDTTPDLADLKTELEYLPGPNFIGVIVFSTVLALALVILGEAGRPLLNVFKSLSEAVLLMTTWITWISPVGIASLIAGEVLKDKDIKRTLTLLGYYILTVMTGFFIHGCIILPAFYILFTRKLPFQFIGQMSKALMTAFGTSSSCATVPITIDCLEQRVKIDSRVVRFLIPMGATLNLAGTALYEAVGSIFIAQVSRKNLIFFEVVLVSLTATLASIGAAGVPSAGTLTMVMVLRSINLDPTLISLVIGFDWILDRFQTVVNVLGDSFGVAIVYHWTKKQLDEVTVDERIQMQKSQMKFTSGHEAMDVSQGPRNSPEDEGMQELSGNNEGESEMNIQY